MLIAFAVSSILLVDPAAELNVRGEALLQHGELSEALAAFRKATEENPRFARAYYNEALTLARLRAQPTTRVRPSKKSVLDAAEHAVQLDPKLRDHLEQDLPAVRTTFRGQRLLGRTVEKDSAAIAQGIVWRSRSGTRLDFLADGTVRYWIQPEWFGRPPTPTGHWSVQGAHLTLVLAGRTHEGGIDGDGVLQLEGLGRFYDW